MYGNILRSGLAALAVQKIVCCRDLSLRGVSHYFTGCLRKINCKELAFCEANKNTATSHMSAILLMVKIYAPKLSANKNKAFYITS